MDDKHDQQLVDDARRWVERLLAAAAGELFSPAGSAAVEEWVVSETAPDGHTAVGLGDIIDVCEVWEVSVRQQGDNGAFMFFELHLPGGRLVYRTRDNDIIAGDGYKDARLARVSSHIDTHVLQVFEERFPDDERYSNGY